MKLIQPVLAKITNPVLKNQDINSANSGTYVNSIIQAFVTLLVIVGVIYFVINFILSGFHMISSQGDPKKFEEAQKSLMYSILGITLVFIVFAIIKLIGFVFGIAGLENLTITWPTI
jgi:heme O synthase-like polyprenyltransferase